MRYFALLSGLLLMACDQADAEYVYPDVAGRYEGDLERIYSSCPEDERSPPVKSFLFVIKQFEDEVTVPMKQTSLSGQLADEGFSSTGYYLSGAAVVDFLLTAKNITELGASMELTTVVTVGPYGCEVVYGGPLGKTN